ncbi:hypothetical protein [Flavobacterium sp. LAR06]|uniref:hypothetical protein n=1 Tax=Flavobacterium sp. LAR06 TaxID=3064897 RepID=UPI0035BFDE8B
MKKTICLLLLNFVYFSNAQSFDIVYTKAYKSNFCGPETFRFSFGNDQIIRTDIFYNTMEWFPSRRKSTEYTNEGFYLETWSPGFFLEENGVDDYYKIDKKFYSIYYDKKGGSLLCFLEFGEVNGRLDIDSGKFYYTQLGYEIMCKK